jgi:leucyl aminopeptidase
VEPCFFVLNAEKMSMKILFKNPKRLNKNHALVCIGTEKFDQVIKEKSTRKIILGIADQKKITARKLIILIRKIVSLAKVNKIQSLTIKLADFQFPQIKLTQQELAEIMTTNLEMANYQFNQYKEKPKEGWEEIEQVIFSGNVSNKTKKSLRDGKLIGESVNLARQMANIPGGDMSPKILVAWAKKITKNLPLKVSVMNEKEMKKKKMEGILSVGKGSSEESKFITIEYAAGRKTEKPMVFVGKAITFDTGGINLKPSNALGEMHMDMAGGAAVIAAIVALASLKVKKNVIALVPAAENMPSGTSYRPGDIIKSMSGKTIEVSNTDAEGRIILADALEYANKFKPKLVVDVATLTGAAMVCLGYRANALYSSAKQHDEKVLKLAEKTGDYLWQMPLWEEYEEEIKGTFGDVNNVGKFPGMGGANTAAAFLFQFAKKYPWMHVDIAPRMTTIEGENLSKGASGTPVRLLIKIAQEI